MIGVSSKRRSNSQPAHALKCLHWSSSPSLGSIVSFQAASIPDASSAAPCDDITPAPRRPPLPRSPPPLPPDLPRLSQFMLALLSLFSSYAVCVRLWHVKNGRGGGAERGSGRGGEPSTCMGEPCCISSALGFMLYTRRVHLISSTATVRTSKLCENARHPDQAQQQRHEGSEGPLSNPPTKKHSMLPAVHDYMLVFCSWHVAAAWKQTTRLNRYAQRSSSDTRIYVRKRTPKYIHTEAHVVAAPPAHLFPRRRLQDAPNFLAHPVLRPRPSRDTSLRSRGVHHHAAAGAACPATTTTTPSYSTGTSSCRETTRDKARASRATAQGLLLVQVLRALPMLASSRRGAFNRSNGGGTAAERSLTSSTHVAAAAHQQRQQQSDGSFRAGACHGVLCASSWSLNEHSQQAERGTATNARCTRGYVRL